MRGLGERTQDIERSNGGSRLLECVEVGADVAAELEKQFVFELLGALLGAEHLTFHFLERGGDVALGIGESLLTGVVIRHLGQLGAGDLDEVTEDVIEFDFQRVDARACALRFLESSDEAFAIARDAAKFIELG